jgi:pyruvate formate lyase activating enzyme
MDTEKHKAYTGVGNERILQNIRRTVEMGKPLVIRTPIVPDCNNSEENIRATGAFVRDELKNRIVQYQLLPYRKMGTEKYATLLMPYPMGDDYVPPERSVWEQNLLDLTHILTEEFGVPAVPGSSHKLF